MQNSIQALFKNPTFGDTMYTSLGQEGIYLGKDTILLKSGVVTDPSAVVIPTLEQLLGKIEEIKGNTDITAIKIDGFWSVGLTDPARQSEMLYVTENYFALKTAVMDALLWVNKNSLEHKCEVISFPTKP